MGLWIVLDDMGVGGGLGLGFGCLAHLLQAAGGGYSVGGGASKGHWGKGWYLRATYPLQAASREGASKGRCSVEGRATGASGHLGTR